MLPRIAVVVIALFLGAACELCQREHAAHREGASADDASVMFPGTWQEKRLVALDQVIYVYLPPGGAVTLRNGAEDFMQGEVSIDGRMLVGLYIGTNPVLSSAASSADVKKCGKRECSRCSALGKPQRECVIGIVGPGPVVHAWRLSGLNSQDTRVADLMLDAVAVDWAEKP